MPIYISNGIELSCHDFSITKLINYSYGIASVDNMDALWIALRSYSINDTIVVAIVSYWLISTSLARDEQ